MLISQIEIITIISVIILISTIIHVKLLVLSFKKLEVFGFYQCCIVLVVNSFCCSNSKDDLSFCFPSLNDTGQMHPILVAYSPGRGQLLNRSEPKQKGILTPSRRL